LAAPLLLNNFKKTKIKSMSGISFDVPLLVLQNLFAKKWVCYEKNSYEN
jgi:hypothetical protein